MDDLVDVVKELYPLFPNGGLVAALHLFHDDAQWVSPPGSALFGHTATGPKEIRQVFDAMAGMGRFDVQPTHFVPDGDDVIVFGLYDWIGPRGGHASCHFVHRWTWEEGKVGRFETFHDTATMNSIV